MIDRSRPHSSAPSVLDAGRQQRLLILAGLAFLSFVVRVYRLDYQSLWRDEVDAVIFATRSLGDIAATFSNVGDNGPLFFLGLHFWIALAGQSEFAIRFPSAVCGVLAVLLTHRLGREVISHEVGLIGAALMAVSPYHIWYGQEAKMYALISLLAPLCLLILVRALRGGPRWLWLAWVALMGAFLYVHLFATMMVLVAITWAPLLVRRRPRLTPALALGIAVLVLASLPVARWLIPAALTPVETGYYRYGLGEMAAILLRNFSMGLRPAAGLWPVILFALLLVLGCAPLVIRPRSTAHGTPAGVTAPLGSANGWPPARGVFPLVLYLLAPLLAIWLVSLRRPTFTDRYLIISLPAFFLLIAAGVVAVSRMAAQAVGQTQGGQGSLSPGTDAREAQTTMTVRQRRIAATRVGLQRDAAAPSVASAALQPPPTPQPVREPATVAAWLATGLAVVLVVASLPFVWAQTHNPYKADFRAATRYVEQQAAADDLFIFLMPYVKRGFTYYHPQPVRSVEPPYTRGMSQEDLDARMRILVAGSTKVMLFLSEQDFWDPEGLIPAWFERNGARRCQQEFAYIEVRCYLMK